METDWIQEYQPLINALYLELDQKIVKDLDTRLKTLINRIELDARLELLVGIRDYMLERKTKLQDWANKKGETPTNELELKDRIYLTGKTMGELELINAILPLLAKGDYATK